MVTGPENDGGGTENAAEISDLNIKISPILNMGALVKYERRRRHWLFQQAREKLDSLMDQFGGEDLSAFYSAPYRGGFLRIYHAIVDNSFGPCDQIIINQETIDKRYLEYIEYSLVCNQNKMGCSTGKAYNPSPKISWRNHMLGNTAFIKYGRNGVEVIRGLDNAPALPPDNWNPPTESGQQTLVNVRLNDLLFYLDWCGKSTFEELS